MSQNDSRHAHAYPGMTSTAPFIRITAGGGCADLTLKEAEELAGELRAAINQLMAGPR